MAKAGRRNYVDEIFVTHADIATDDVAGTLMSSSAGMERPAGMASETSFLVAAPLTGNAYADRASEEANLIAFDATQITSRVNRNNPKPGDPCHPLAALAHPPVIIGFANTAGDTNLGIRSHQVLLGLANIGPAFEQSRRHARWHFWRKRLLGQREPAAHALGIMP